MPFGLAVATTFLNHLHASPGARMESAPEIKDIIRHVFDDGGQIVDDELRSLVVDMYNLYKQLNMTLEKL